mgnify:CR=1 FL=1
MPHCRRTYYYQVRRTFLQFVVDEKEELKPCRRALVELRHHVAGGERDWHGVLVGEER